MNDENIADVGLSTGRQFLKVAGVIVAVEGDKCRDSSSIPEEVLPPIPDYELEHAMIGDKKAKELPTNIVRFFRGDAWNGKMLQYVADTINKAVQKKCVTVIEKDIAFLDEMILRLEKRDTQDVLQMMADWKHELIAIVDNEQA